MLAELVQSGQLPPLSERLPEEPGVLPVAESVGKLGGMVRRGFKGVSDRWGPTKMQDHGLGWYDQSLVMRPRLATSWEINEDASEWTFHLRKGAKWSNGEPQTSKDIQWFYQYILLNETLTPSPDSTYSTGSPLVMSTWEFPDDYTWKIKFANPNPLFIYNFGRTSSDGRPFINGDYMSQYHIDLVADKAALEQKVKDAGFETWDQLFTNVNYWYMSPDRPTYGPWLPKNALSEEQFVMSRNPYFFATDKEGQQLPYLDQIAHQLYQTPDVFNLWIVGGEIDFQARGVDIGNYTLYKESEDKGDYQVLLAKSANHVCVQLNQTTKDQRLREFFQDQKVRIALSLAVDREGLNTLVYSGLLVPRQYSPLSMSPNAYPKQANAYIDYDPDQANQLLDEAGYTEKDSDGFRKWNDGSGETISFTIEGTDEPGSPGEDAIQQIVKYYAAVGIKAAYKYYERSLYTAHYEANDIEAAFWGGDRTVLPLAPGAPIFRGTMIDRPWCVAWGLWQSTNGTDPNAEKPPDGHWIWDIWGIWDQISVEPNEDKRNELFTGILDIWAEQLPMIGYLGETPAPVIVKNGFHNYLPGEPMDDTTGDENVLGTETYYWDDPSQHV